MSAQTVDLTVCPDCGLPEATGENLDRMCNDIAHDSGERLVRFAPVPEIPTHPTETTRDDGLTEAEGIVADAALAVVNGYAKLPVQHPNDMRDICDAVHRVQDLLAVRIARRHYPKGWPVKNAE